ncbi:iron ABC transporter permease [Sphingomonadales bacterium 56]|uniref:FecCD family ABC transporter permease n=1 Tax=unclassified Sphingobium TaxID=2611147 RepID=UPI00191A00ED|nr:MULTISPECIES: iron ABC transporter permease [unclassified Sphingobium]MBY2928646.1 iron ABC transporter permease [Sphingomonadales bacterium 56]MBY2959506.1 iron ABC transporter permease [Sphingomonadales bacterium 58]CAD7337735.1 Hemin transport system permease protein HmuU [Sphingobium sp. S6]CAD7339123.1 Hemin transport system permease protein HmuU [Sphingobium sp. S8]
MSARRHPLLLPVLIALTLVAALGSLTLGAVPLAPVRILAVLSGGGDEVARAILIDLRLPRMLLGLIVGAMLGLAGAALQGYLRNPLAEPSVLGASNAAALGAVCALYFGLAQLHPLILPVLAITTSLIAIGTLFLLAGPSESPLTLILAGIAVATLAGAGISLSLNLSPNPFAAMEIMSWLMGSLENRSYAHVWIALPCVLIGAALLIADGRSLDALTLGEEGAQALGVDLTKARLRMMLGVAIGVGGAVAVSGAIGFVGLIVPHLVRPLTDRSPSAILLPSLLGGAALLTLADIGVRLIPTSSELKLGVLTALLGVPVFLVHLMRERRLW